MLQLIPFRRQVLIVTALAIVLAWGAEALLEKLQGEPATPLKFISLIATIIAIVGVGGFSLVWRFLWRKLPWLARKTFPDLNGTWKGTLVSTWCDPITGQAKPPIPTTIWIRQTPLSMSVKLHTGESTSHSMHCILEANHEAGRFRVWYSYDNRPRAELAPVSGQHQGFAWLENDVDTAPDQLFGQYYTSRRTTGDMTLRRVSRKLLNG